MPTTSPLYQVTSLAGSHKLIAHVMFDRKNNSIHFHFYSSLFGNKRSNIQVKHAEVKFPEGKDSDVIRQILPGCAPVQGIQIKSITKRKETDGVPEGKPVRVIVRFMK